MRFVRSARQERKNSGQLEENQSDSCSFFYLQSMAVTDKQKSAQLLRRYGINLSEYDLLMTLQDEACAICKKPETARDPKSHRCIALAVDHDHATGAIRGLLCSKCNRALGYLNDDINLLLAGVAYLSRHTTRKVDVQDTRIERGEVAKMVREQSREGRRISKARGAAKEVRNKH